MSIIISFFPATVPQRSDALSEDLVIIRVKKLIMISNHKVLFYLWFD